jgi:hypothetical protein
MPTSGTLDVSKWAGSLYLAAATHNGWDILGVRNESWGVSEYLIFD